MSFIGKLLYRLYYEPKNQKATVAKFGGKQNYAEMLSAEREMRSYALDELEIPGDFNDAGKFRINFLTGDRFIHQTLFCTYSLFKFLGPGESADFSVNYYSDGTLSDPVVKTLKTRFPNIRLISIGESLAAAAVHLPLPDFPRLNKNINNLPLFKKLVFPHLNAAGPAIFLDSDMLFLQRPEVFLTWLYKYGSSKEHAFCILDTQRCYGYSDEQIFDIWPHVLKNDINSGMYCLRSELIDFALIEDLVRKFETSYGSQYYLEQLITAILLEKTGDLFTAPAEDYIVLPAKEQIKYQTGTLHHYVNESKEFYFKESWKKQVALE